MKKVLFLILACIQISYAQTKSETEQWIVNKLDTFTDNVMNFDAINHEIKSGYLIRNYYSNDKITVIQSRMLIKEIASYRYEITETNIGSAVNIHLYCKNSSRCAETIVYKNGKFEEFLSTDTKDRILLNINFRNENLPDRMRKAITNLVGFYGGQIMTEKY